jgi:hypothetical protein
MRRFALLLLLALIVAGVTTCYVLGTPDQYLGPEVVDALDSGNTDDRR